MARYAGIYRHDADPCGFSQGRTNSRKVCLVQMDGGDSPHSSSAKIKLIVSVVAQKHMFLDLHLYEHLKWGRL